MDYSGKSLFRLETMRPGEMSCSVKKNGEIKLRLEKGSGRSPVEREAAHLLKSASDILDGIKQSMQTPAGSKPK